jgi:LacI family transcriptional regulator
MQVYSRQDPAIELERIERLLAFRVGGVILVPSLKPQAALERLAKTETPTVILNRPIDDERFDQVMVDHREAVREVVDHLIDRGHKKIVLASQFPTLSVTRWRVVAIKETVKRRGTPIEVVALKTGATEVEFFDRLAPHLSGETGTVALICSNSLVTTWALRMARSLGRQSPADFSLVALDDPEWADIVTPRLSAVHQPTDAVARKAMDTLIARMNRVAGKPRRVLIAADVRFRDSVRSA